MLAWLIVALVALCGLFLLAGGDMGTGDETPYLILGATVLGAYALWLLGSYRGSLGKAALYLAIWLLAALALVAAYSYRDAFSHLLMRVGGELLPPGHGLDVSTGEPGQAAVQVRRRPGGQFVAHVEVNGSGMTMLVDTGASAVVLKSADAARAGIDTSALDFSVAVQTANGTAYTAPVRLHSVTVGAIEVRDVDALVAKPGSLPESLLGMSFLKRLRSYEFSGDYLTLRG